jgi:undecaprenyl-diphosphatase
MDLLQIVLLGLIQGLTEFLPVSSSGHLVLLPKLFNWQDPGLNVDAFLHLGTLLAVLIYFRKDLYKIAFDKENIRLRNGIIIATLPAVLLGFTLKSFFETNESIRSIGFIALTMFLGAIGLLLFEKFSSKSRQLDDLKLLEIFFIGLMQALALFPGLSRSGICITAALILGLKREDSARFAFLVGVPAIAGAGLLSLKDLLEAHFSSASNIDTNWFLLSVGFLVSFISGLWAIDFLIKFLKTKSLLIFVIYRILLAALLLIFV